MALYVGNVEIDPDGDPSERVARHLGIGPDALVSVVLVRKSLDARHKRPLWRAGFKVEVRDEAALLKRRPHSVRPWTDRDELRYGLSEGTSSRRRWPEGIRPIVVGAGPGGLFAALHLAEAGAPVLLLERGAPVEERVGVVNKQWQRKAPLDPESNVVFGEGGAGTFSDGKIYTRRRDGDLGWIFRRLVDCGADAAILQESYAHLGTDKVRQILPKLREKLAAAGCEIRFHAQVADLVVEGGRCVGVVLADGTIERGGPVIVAAGHSARDTARMMHRHGAAAERVSIAIGARIEHPQALVDRAMYGGEERAAALPAASYRLAWNPPGGRSVYTFCMCPGGMVVPANNLREHVVVNGMSFAARRAFWANSAVIVQVRPEDYGGEGPLAGYDWQDAIERAAYALGGRDDRAPAQKVVDLAAGKASAELPKTSFPMGVAPSDLRELLPGFVIDGMLGAVRRFERDIPGFAGDEAVLIAPETRTTSPVRFLRDEGRESASLPGLYPVGEGAGYGGGIISCSLDGYRTAQAIVARLSVTG